MPNVSPTDATIHATQYLIHTIHNPSPAIPIVKQVNVHKEALITLAEISRKSTVPEIPPRVSFRGAYQGKLQQVNQE